MSSATFPLADTSRWLKSYYFTRAGVSIAWVAAAFTLGKASPPIAAALLVAYPAWDAAANYVDASRSGGLKANQTQALNVVVSLVTAVAVGLALKPGMHSVLGVFGGWAILSGLLQLFTGIRRLKAKGQWPMIISGGQSALAGGYFIKLATGAVLPGITDIAPYAGFGAVFFIASGVRLAVVQSRRQKLGHAA